MALPTSTPLSLTDIDAEFGLGLKLAAYKGLEVLNFDGNLAQLPTSNLYITDFLGTSKVPPEEYSTATISLQSLQSTYRGFYNATNVQVSTGVAIKLPAYPKFRPKPTRFETEITWFKYDGSQWVDIGFTNNELITLQPTDANAGTYKIEIRHTVYAPSDQDPHSAITPGPELAVVTSFTSKTFDFTVSEFELDDPYIFFNGTENVSPAKLQVVDYENTTKPDTSGILTHTIGQVDTEFVNGTNFGRPFIAEPTVAVTFQYSANNLSWVDMKQAFSGRPSPVTDSTWPGPTFIEYGIYGTKSAGPTIGMDNSQPTHSWQFLTQFRMKDFAYDTTKTPDPWWDGYYFRIKVVAEATYDVAGVAEVRRHTAVTDGTQLSLVRTFIENDNQCPESQNIKVALPVNGTKTIDMADIVSDPDGEVIAIDSIIHTGSGTVTQSGTSITLNMAGTNQREPQTMFVGITDNSTRPGGPCVKISTITWLPGNTPPVNGGYSVNIPWSPPDPAIDVFERNFSLLRNSFDVNSDTMTIDEASLPDSIQGVAEGFGLRVNGTKLGMTFNKGYAGLTEFEYKVKDSQGALSDFNTASILVKTTNVAPFISDAEIFVEEFSTNTIELFNIMNMSDFEGSNLVITNITALSGNNGSTIALNNNTTINVDASSVGNGTESRFNITITDGSNATRTATLTVSTVAEPCPLVSVTNVDLGTILNNVSIDLENSLLSSASNSASVNNYTFEIFSVENNGIGQLNGLVYSGIGDIGTIDISYRIKNSCGSVSAIGNVTGTLIADNVAPIANNFTKKTDYNTPITINLTAYGTDEDNDTLSVAVVKYWQQIDYLNLSGNNITVTPNPSNTDAHTLSFNYRLSDGQALSNWATGSVAVRAFVPPKPTFSISSNNITEGRSVRMTVTLLGANVDSKEFAIQFKEYYNGALHKTSLSKRTTTSASAKDGDTISFDYKTDFENELHTSRTVTARIVAQEEDFSNHDQSKTVTIANEAAFYGDTFKKIVVDEGQTTPAGVGVYAKNVTTAQRNGWTWTYPTLSGNVTGSFNLVWDSNTKLYRSEIRVAVPAYPNNYEDQVGEVSVFKPNGSLYGKFTVIGKNTDIALTVPAINGVDKFDIWTEDGPINTSGPLTRATLSLRLDGTYNDGTWSNGVFTAETWASNPPFDAGWTIQTRNVNLNHSGDTNPPIFSSRGLDFRIAADYEPQYRTPQQQEQDRNNMIGMPISFSVTATGQYRVIWSDDSSKVSNWSTFRVGLATAAYEGTGPGDPTPPQQDPPPPAERVILESVCERPNGVNTGYRIDIYNTEPTEVRVYDVSTCPLPVAPPPPATVLKAYCEQDTNGNTGVFVTEMSDGTVNRNTNTTVCPLPVAPPVTVTSAYCEKNNNGENTGQFTTEFSDGTSVTINNIIACPLPAAPPTEPTVEREYCEIITIARGRTRRTGTLVQVLSNGLTREVQDSVTCPPGLIGGGPGPGTVDPAPTPVVTGPTNNVERGGLAVTVDTTPNAEVTVRDNISVGNQNRYTNGLNFRGGGPVR